MLSINSIAHQIANQSGATWNHLGEQPDYGFAVATQGNEEKYAIGIFSEAIIADYQARHPLCQGQFWGAWVNSEDGNVYLDVSTVFDNFTQAIEEGRKSHQIAIFDLGEHEEITIVYDDEPIDLGEYDESLDASTSWIDELFEDDGSGLDGSEDWDYHGEPEEALEDQEIDDSFLWSEEE